MEGYPRLRTWVWYVGTLIACWAGAFLLAETGGGFEKLGMEEPARSVGVVGLAMMGVGFGVGAFWTLVDWVWWRANMRSWEWRRLAAVTPTSELDRVVATLRPDQTALLPMARYGAEVGRVPGLAGPEQFLITPFMNIPLDWLWEYLNELCTRIELYPVRRFSSDSLEQRYAQAFTAWVTQPQMHLALPASGPDPAKWVSPGARERCVEMIWGKQEGE